LLFLEFPGKRTSLPASPVGRIWREMPVSRAFLYISFTVPSKGALPPCSPRRVLVERQSTDSLRFLSLEVSGKRTSPPAPPTGPLWAEMPLFRTFFYTLHGATPPSKKSSNLEETKFLLSLKVSGKGVPSM